MRIPLALTLIAVLSYSPPSQEAPPRPLSAVGRLAGHWHGRAQGFYLQAEVEATWEFVLDRKFLQGRTTFDDNGPLDETLSMLSWDDARGCFVLREFSSGGYVVRSSGNFDAEGNLQLDTEAWENGWGDEARARIVFSFPSEDRLRMTTYMAFGASELARFAEVTLDRAD